VSAGLLDQAVAFVNDLGEAELREGLDRVGLVDILGRALRLDQGDVHIPALPVVAAAVAVDGVAVEALYCGTKYVANVSTTLWIMPLLAPMVCRPGVGGAAAVRASAIAVFR